MTVSSAARDIALDYIYTAKRFRETFGRPLNLARPQTFNEWINWKKLHDRRPLLTQLADKAAVRQYVTERIGASYLPQLFLIADDPSALERARLPNRFVVKATHGSGCTILVRDRARLNRAQLSSTCASWLAINFYTLGREWCYRDIPPRILVEELLEDERGGVPCDFKFFCFAGIPKFVEVDVNRFGDHRRNLYDVDWNLLPAKLHLPNFDQSLPAPGCLREMCRVAASLAMGLDFVRVDLYGIGGRVVFGEMTNYPGNGFQCFSPAEYDEIFGREWPARVDACRAGL